MRLKNERVDFVGIHSLKLELALLLVKAFVGEHSELRLERFDVGIELLQLQASFLRVEI